MGWGGGGGGGWGKGGGSRGGGSQKPGAGRRQKEQEQLKTAKNARESDYFWQKQASFGGGKPHELKGWKLQEKEQELFGGHDGTVGIDFKKYDDIPVEVSGAGSEEIPAIETFQELYQHFELPAFLKTNIQKCKYSKPTPIQRFAIPIGLSGYDAMCCAQTGSGKTCAFLMPILAQIDETTATGNVGIQVGQPASPKAVVMAPTRELCSQIHVEAQKLAWKSKIRASEIYGGVDAKPQLWEIALGSDLVTATPGRLTDFIDRGVITMSTVQFLVLDEADRMLDMGFEPQIRQIVQQRDMPSSQQGRRTLMFSATFPKEIQRLATQFMRQYIWVGVGQVGAAVDTVKQTFIEVQGNGKKQDKVAQLLRENPTDTTLVFVAMKRTAAALVEHLQYQGCQAVAIHGDMDQPAREQSLKRFKSGQVNVMVATDVAARGLDIPTVSHVINCDLPEIFEDYIHRIGRTGRVGRHGWATSLFSTMGNYSNHKILGRLLGALEENGQEIPAFMQREAQQNGIRAASNKKSFGGADHRGGKSWTGNVSGGKGGSKGGKSGGGGCAVAGKGTSAKGKAAVAKGGATGGVKPKLGISLAGGKGAPSAGAAASSKGGKGIHVGLMAPSAKAAPKAAAKVAAAPKASPKASIALAAPGKGAAGKKGAAKGGAPKGGAISVSLGVKRPGLGTGGPPQKIARATYGQAR